MGSFVDSPMSSEFQKDGKIPEGGPGTYNGCKEGPFAEHGRTSSPNAVPELTYDKSLKEKPSGESDQF